MSTTEAPEPQPDPEAQPQEGVGPEPYVDPTGAPGVEWPKEAEEPESEAAHPESTPEEE